MKKKYDAVIVGAGPNGLAAAITIARAGHSVLVLEANETIGGGARSAQLTLPRFIHDPCSAIHPLALASPFFKALPLEKFGLDWIHPAAPLAHPLDDGTAIILERSIDATAAQLGRDARAYARLYSPFVRGAEKFVVDLLGPLPLPPRDAILFTRFGINALLPASLLARFIFRDVRARALFAGMSAHSMLSLDAPITSAFGLTLGILGHSVGWPLPRGGAQKIADALAGYLKSLGGEIVANQRVTSLDELPRAHAILFDTTPREFLNIARDRVRGIYRAQLKNFRYGAGVFKMDWALDAPIPWQAQECLRAGTVHLGGTLEEIAASERAVARGAVSARPYVLLAQQSLFDPSRAPAGKHTAWAYIHVPNNWNGDATEIIENQIERFAPGFRARILARHSYSPAQMEQHDANFVGGDINAGAQNLFQLYTRPAWNFLNPYATSLRGIYLCSSSTPPGGGVHGMCGYHAARAALREIFQ
ncbi:MAG: NAD(P)/FAD-dependent oxidoreductase [Chloroflexi bacterium]|nr:NAD(P)/FAD-dependent oxidoreductase [Chloroflexota bacterium]